MNKKLYKSNSDKKLDGVCAGIAKYFGIDPTLVRLACAILTLLSIGTGIVIYLVCALILPREPEENNDFVEVE